uniref:RNase H type-1 domain-containing protein n=1 Tax=Quercus lobata TaxID=97700 RepID=A0A7N2KW82_QUELO
MGNGESIRVRHDRWLPNPSTFKLTSPLAGLPFDAKHVGDEILELVITIAWSIWFNQNQVRQGKADQTASMIIKGSGCVKQEASLPLRPLEAEVKATEEAVELAWDVGIQDAHFKSDSLILSIAIQGVEVINPRKF